MRSLPLYAFYENEQDIIRISQYGSFFTWPPFFILEMKKLKKTDLVKNLYTKLQLFR